MKKTIYVAKNGTEKVEKWYGGKRKICQDEFEKTGEYQNFNELLYTQGYHVVDGRKFKNN